MAIGPLESFAFPGVFTRTITEATATTAAGDIRFPALIGVGAEELRVSDFEMIRGSSAVADNLIIDEDVADQLDGTNKVFTVDNFPIVTGDGQGTVATLHNNVIVLVNDEPVPVAKVEGLIGQVTLVTIPTATDTVRVNYYYKRRDTYIEDENLSDQADGTNKSFKVKSRRIVTGDNGGTSATDTDINQTVAILYDPTTSVGDEFTRTVPIIQVTVDDNIATITDLDGADGMFTLSTAPASDAIVLVDYFTNDWQNTFDILPAAQVSRLVNVGLSQDTSDFSIGNDCVLASPNRIHWGHSVQTQTGISTAGATPLVDSVVASLRDDRVYGRLSTPKVPATDASDVIIRDALGRALNSTTNKAFMLPTNPVNGTGAGKPTENMDDGPDAGSAADIIAYVGSDWDSALAAGPVTITKVDGNTIWLATAPSQALEEKVFVTYYENNLIDESWTITNKVSGGIGVGKYIITSRVSGNGIPVTLHGGSVSPVYAGAGAVDTQVNPLKGSVERVTITFDGVGGFTVTSKLGPTYVTDGRTGSVTTNEANKGYLGQTYIDPTTGFRVSFSGDSGAFNPVSGDTVVYDLGNPDTSSAEQKYYIDVGTDFVRAIPGINLTVSNTSGGGVDNVDNTVIVRTYNRSGNEPSIGDAYYVSFDRLKTSYRRQFFVTMSEVIREYGPIDPNNPIVVAANLMFLNGARAVAIKQIQKAAGQTDATVQAYINGINDFDEPLPNGLRPSLIQPLTTNSEVQNHLRFSNATQSNLRYRNERTSIIGFATGTTPDQVIQRVKAIKSEKITAVYPDSGILAIEDAFGNEVEYIFDGAFIAAALAGRDSSPVNDIATSLTKKSIVGFRRLNRSLDNVTASLVANSGCTVLEDRNNAIRIMFYLTTDLSTPLTRNPRIVEVKHFIQQGMRNVLDRYIGVKNLPRVIPQVTGTVNSYFRSLKQANIIADYKPANVSQNTTDPSTLDVEVFYSPVFPVNWIVVTLNLRSSI